MSSSEDEDDLSIYESVKKADLDAVSYALAQNSSQEALLRRGDDGETALHIASQLGRLDMVKLLVQHGAGVRCPSEGPASTGQHPIHWATGKGQLHIVDYLIKNGASIEEPDKKGCTPLMIAAQSGQLTLILYLISRTAALHARDSEGDTALHWAASQGQQEVCELLISKGMDINALDNCGQNPLHLACVSGKPGTVDCLLQNGVDKNAVDQNGNTPVMIAKKRGNKAATEMLEGHGMTLMGMLKYFTPMGFFFGAPGRHKQQMKLFLFEAFCIGYPYYLYMILPVTLNSAFPVHILILLMNVVMWYSFIKIQRVDPGFVRCDTVAYEQGLNELMNRDSFDTLKMHNLGKGKQVLALPDFCHSCKIVRPPRSKHCKFCRRCVLVHDHHCPYLDQCIAYGNRIYFTAFIWSIFILTYCALYLMWSIWKAQSFRYLNLFILINVIFFGAMINIMIVCHFILVTGNITTYECAASPMNPAFRLFNGRYTNPYNRGTLDNALEYFHLKPPLDLATIQPVTAVQSV